jgi:hypothetical protein
MNKLYFLIPLFSITFVYPATAKEEFNVQKIISSADIIRNTYSNDACINLYQGNGVFGSSYSLTGLHIRPDAEEKLGKYGKTQFMNLAHWGRGKFAADYLLPLAKIYWEKDFYQLSDFQQHQSFYDGTITTQFKSVGKNYEVKTWYDPFEKNIAGILIRANDDSRNVIFDPCRALNVHYNQKVAQTVQFSENKGTWKVDITGLEHKTTLYLTTNATVTLVNNALSLKLRKGSNKIIISANTVTRTTLENSLKQTTKWWNTIWESSGCVRFPDQNANKMWVRSMALFLSSFGDDKKGLTPSMGLTGNGWPFSFPQDLFYVQPLMLSTGNLNISKSWIEYFSQTVQGMKDYTRRLFNTEGIFCPWDTPYGEYEGYHSPSPPNKYYYEIHNSGYLSRMTTETAAFINDSAWTTQYALPLIKGTAEFYKSFCRKESDGLWHLFIKPSMGQDENGGVDQKDYLCALYSAKYCFQQAIAHHLDKDGIYAKILDDGLAFDALKSKNGYYYTSGGSGEKDFGRQKHPVQLNELAYLPVNTAPSQPASIAYQQRYDLTINSKKPFFAGWTLGEFLLAGSRYGNSTEWLKDWDNLLKSNNIDPDWIQVYESSGAWKASFYSATNGLITQSLLNNVISDYYGKLEVAKCFPWEGEVLVKNIYSILGVKISGRITKGKASLHLTAWKDCKLQLNELEVSMKKGESKDFVLVLQRNQ